MEMITKILADFGVDWPKFIAQVILFTTVYLVLSKFAFKPVVAMLEERRRKIEEAQANAEAIKKQLAEAEQRYAEMLAQANRDAQRIVDEAKTSGAGLLEKKTRDAITEAEQILAKARDAAENDRDRMMAELKREVGRLVVDTTKRVAGKVLTPEDQRRLADEAAKEIAA
jgi:F-type H+-transporting ATPase subunit b